MLNNIPTNKHRLSSTNNRKTKTTDCIPKTVV